MVGYPYWLFIKHMVSMRGAGHKNGIKSAYLHLITDEMASVFSKPHLEENQFPMAPPRRRSPPGCHGTVSTWVRTQPSGAPPPSAPSSGPTLCAIHRGRAALFHGPGKEMAQRRSGSWIVRAVMEEGEDGERWRRPLVQLGGGGTRANGDRGDGSWRPEDN